MAKLIPPEVVSSTQRCEAAWFIQVMGAIRTRPQPAGGRPAETEGAAVRAPTTLRPREQDDQVRPLGGGSASSVPASAAGIRMPPAPRAARRRARRSTTAESTSAGRVHDTMRMSASRNANGP